jgi:hypothetical protein
MVGSGKEGRYKRVRDLAISSSEGGKANPGDALLNYVRREHTDVIHATHFSGSSHSSNKDFLLFFNAAGRRRRKKKKKKKKKSTVAYYLVGTF